MEKQRKSWQFRFKMSDVYFDVSIEDSSKSIIKKDTNIKNIHYHAVYELFFANEYPVSLHTSDNVYEYHNCILCVPPFFKHCTKRDGGCRILFSFHKTKKNSGDFSSFMEGFFSPDKPFTLSPDKAVYFYATELLNLFPGENFMTEEIAVSLLKMIFFGIYESQSQKESNEKSIHESYIVKIDNILTNFSRDINLSTVAKKLCLSTKQASRIIKKHYKKTLSQLLCEKRLAFATQMLLEDNKSIFQIVEEVNFPSESYFYAQFKKAYGCTPLQYKKSNLPLSSPNHCLKKSLEHLLSYLFPKNMPVPTLSVYPMHNFGTNT